MHIWQNFTYFAYDITQFIEYYLAYYAYSNISRFDRSIGKLRACLLAYYYNLLGIFCNMHVAHSQQQINILFCILHGAYIFKTNCPPKRSMYIMYKMYMMYASHVKGYCQGRAHWIRDWNKRKASSLQDTGMTWKTYAFSLHSWRWRIDSYPPRLVSDQVSILSSDKSEYDNYVRT